MYGLFKLQCKSIVIDVKGEENLCVRFFNKKDFYALDTAVHPCSLLWKLPHSSWCNWVVLQDGFLWWVSGCNWGLRSKETRKYQFYYWN